MGFNGVGRSFKVCCISLVFATLAHTFPTTGTDVEHNSVDTGTGVPVAPVPTPRTRNTRPRYTIHSLLGYDPKSTDSQTQKDLRILSLFEDELSQIFNCYVRLSCPKTRDADTIRECEHIKDWPLYHQVMRMAGILRYPYSSYAPRRAPGTGKSENPNPSNNKSARRVRYPTASETAQTTI